MRQEGLKHHPATKVQRGSGWSSNTRIQGRFVSHNTIKESFHSGNGAMHIGLFSVLNRELKESMKTYNMLWENVS